MLVTLIASMVNLPPSPVSSYRGRLAPSPTGYLHVGHARTFWTAFERVRDAGGALVMRMEDLDPDRSRAAYAEAAIEDLRWLGIRWQEGPDKGGPFTPYAQSRRRQSIWPRGASCCGAAICSPAAVRARTLKPRSARRTRAFRQARTTRKAMGSWTRWTTNPSIRALVGQ